MKTLTYFAVAGLVAPIATSGAAIAQGAAGLPGCTTYWSERHLGRGSPTSSVFGDCGARSDNSDLCRRLGDRCRSVSAST